MAKKNTLRKVPQKGRMVPFVLARAARRRIIASPQLGARMSCSRLLPLIACLAVVGCGDTSEGEPPAGPPVSALPGVYAGQFPCMNCPGISAALWLRPDGRYFIRQRYLADERDEETIAYGLGRWRWLESDSTILLAGEGPPRVFKWPDRDTLIMQTESDLEHRLARDPGAPDFTSSIRMSGTMRQSGENMLFTECLTGLEAPVKKGRDYARFQHQYRSVPTRGEGVFVELEGRFAWSNDGAPEALTIDRFVTVRASESCPAAGRKSPK